MFKIKIFQLLLLAWTVASGTQLQQLKKIELHNSNPTAFNVLASNDGATYVVVGYENGVIEYINVENGTVMKKIKFSERPIEEIRYGRSLGRVFVRDNKRIGYLGRDGILLESWKAKEPIIGMSVAKNQQGFGFIGVVHQKFVSEYIYEQNTNSSQYFYNVYDSIQNKTNLAVFHPMHTHLYIIFDQNSQLAVFDLSPQLKVKLNLQNFEINKENISKKGEKGPRAISYGTGEVTLKRKFNFKVKKILVDDKEPQNGDRQGLILVSFDDVIYYTKQGSIYTFIPFKHAQQDQLISLDFCEKRYILTLHKHMNQSKSLFFLTYFNKRTLMPQKTVLINSLFQKELQIKLMNCNSQIVVFLTQNAQLLVLKNHIESQIIPINHQKQQITNIIQWGLTAFIFLLFVCFCRKKNKRQNNQANEQTAQINESQKQKQSNVQSSIKQQQKQSLKTSKIKKLHEQVPVCVDNRKRKRKIK